MIFVRIHQKYKYAINAAIALLAVAALIFYSYNVDTTQSELAPKCLFLKLTGFKCPGCGTQRALHALAHFDIAGVARYNVFLFFALPYLALLFFLQFFGGKELFPRLTQKIYSAKAIMAVFYLIMAYWITRNIFNF